MASITNYFLSYMRQGLATLASFSNLSEERMTLDIAIDVEAKNKQQKAIIKKGAVKKTISLLGPGDVLGFNPRVIRKKFPADNVSNFESNLLPYIEFNQADFLWRFSTKQQKNGEQTNWIPWLSLIVLKTKDGAEKGEFTFLPQADKELPHRIELTQEAILPDLKEAWRWAHIHLLETEVRAENQLELVKTTLRKQPQKAVCRLLCSRKLKPSTKYYAFVVPTYKIGAERAMGRTNGTKNSTLLTWDTPASGKGMTLPYYFQWQFQTGSGGDFEDLAERLEGRPLQNLGRQTIDASNPGYGMVEDNFTIELESALQSFDFKATPFPIEKAKALANLLNQRTETTDSQEKAKLRVSPPVYGEWYIGGEKNKLKLKPNKKEQWLEELNLDFRQRIAAGLGVQFVKENQEDLMKAAWKQLSEVKKVNRTLNLARFGRAVSGCMHQRLTNPALSENVLFKFTLPLKNKIDATQSVQGVTGDNLAKPRGATSTNPKTIGAVLKNSNVSNYFGLTKFTKYIPRTATPTTKVGAATGTIAMGSASTYSYNPIAEQAIVSTNFTPAGLTPPITKIEATTYTVSPEVGFGEIKVAIAQTLNPKQSIENKFKKRLEKFRAWEKPPNENKPKSRNATEKDKDPLRNITWHPEFHQPMYRFLRDLSQHYILAGLEKVPPNTITLVATNNRFIESFMMGLNHEFAAELRWREFPTDMQGSYFRSFWDTSIYSVDDNEKEAFRSSKIATNLLTNIQRKYGASYSFTNQQSHYNIEEIYLKNNTTDIERAIAMAYEAAIEKWLLTREEDKDIQHPARWKKNTALGAHTTGTDTQSKMVLLIRGELLQKYPNTLIYLVKKENGTLNLTKNTQRVFPVFEGALPPDIIFLGLPINKEVAADYFLIFEERVSELRFGLDIKSQTDTIDDFSWTHFPTLPEEGYLDAHQPSILADEWGSAAFVGRGLLQQPVRVVIKLESLISEIDNKLQ